MKYILTTLLVLISFSFFGQESDSKEWSDTDEVALAVIENVPVFPGCRGDNESKRNCMSQKIAKFISKKFNI